MLENKVGIVILNYNDAFNTTTLVKSIVLNLSDKYFLVIIDNNSPNFKELIRSMGNLKYKLIANQEQPNFEIKNKITLIKLKENGGYSKGNNFGLRLLHFNNFKYAFVLNPDIEITDINVFQHLVEFLQSKNNVGIAAPKGYLLNGKKQGIFKRPDLKLVIYNFLFPISEFILRIIKFIELKFYGYNTIYSAVGSFYAINLTILAKLNFFDEAIFLYNEELVIGEKLKSAKKQFCYMPSLSFKHNHIDKSDPSLNYFLKESYEFYLNNYIKTSKRIRYLIFLSKNYRHFVYMLLKLPTSLFFYLKTYNYKIDSDK